MEKSKYGIGEKIDVKFNGVVTAIEYRQSQNMIIYRVESEHGLAFLTEKEITNACSTAI